MHNYVTANSRFPTSGKGIVSFPTDGSTAANSGGYFNNIGNGSEVLVGFGQTAGTVYGKSDFNVHSFFYEILPFVEKVDLYNAYAPNQHYTSPQNSAVAKVAIPSYLCPVNPYRPANGLDSKGYGYCDIDAYIDINSLGTGTSATPPFRTGFRRAACRVFDARDIPDGLSSTIGLFEDVGRSDTWPARRSYCWP